MTQATEAINVKVPWLHYVVSVCVLAMSTSSISLLLAACVVRQDLVLLFLAAMVLPVSCAIAVRQYCATYYRDQKSAMNVATVLLFVASGQTMIVYLIGFSIAFLSNATVDAGTILLVCLLLASPIPVFAAAWSNWQLSHTLGALVETKTSKQFSIRDILVFMVVASFMAAVFSYCFHSFREAMGS